MRREHECVQAGASECKERLNLRIMRMIALRGCCSPAEDSCAEEGQMPTFQIIISDIRDASVCH